MATHGASSGSQLEQEIERLQRIEEASEEKAATNTVEKLEPAFGFDISDYRHPMTMPSRVPGATTSRYDERGPAWFWNNFSCSEHTGDAFRCSDSLDLGQASARREH